MADTLTFDPLSEFEILETFDFSEEVQRSEETRFFTLAEQLDDFQSKAFVGKRAPTRHERRQIAYESRRYEDLYNSLIVFSETESGYAISTDRKVPSISWVTPVYTEFDYKQYDYDASYMPIMSTTSERTPNYYDRLIRALPSPFATKESKSRLLDSRMTLVNEKGEKSINGLPNYVKPKYQSHEDGSFDVVPVEISNTSDNLRTRGYFLSPRGLDIPNPLSNNAFLNSTEPKFVESSDSLVDIFPAVTTIVNHAVPVTTDPYGEGAKYLKLYDVKLTAIPWKSWKERFPPADEIVAAPQVLSVTFPNKTEQEAPSKDVQNVYVIPWKDGYATRQWLSMQEDSGLLVVKWLLSDVGDAGLVPPEIVGERLMPQFPRSSADECYNFDSFESLLNSGSYRSALWKEYEHALKHELEFPLGMCINNEYIAQERSIMISQNRVAWRETTKKEMLEDYVKLLRLFQLPLSKEKQQKFEKYTSEPDSELQVNVNTILNDPTRDDEDKAKAIQTLLNLLTPHDNQYFDVNNRQIICMHTLSLLRGDLEDNEKDFYARWATVDDGAHICKYCGIEIDRNVFVSQAEFDEDGRLIISQSILETEIFRGGSAGADISASVLELKELFKLEDSTGELILYSLLGILGILPTPEQLKPIIDYIRAASKNLEARKVAKSTREKIEGIFGIMGAVILLQTHDPFLVPKGTLGVRSFKLQGFPRDTDDPNNSPVIDSVINALKDTIENLGKGIEKEFQGSIAPLFRAITSSTKDVRKDVVKYLELAVKTRFRDVFVNARLRYIAPINDEVISERFPLIRLDKLEYSPSDTLGKEEQMSHCVVPRPKTIFSSKIPPSVTQAPLELYKNLKISRQATFLLATIPPAKFLEFTEKEIRERLKVKFAKIGKSDKIEKFVDNGDGISILAMMSRVLDILSTEDFDRKLIEDYRATIETLQTRTSSSLLRDIAKGLFYELFKEISNTSTKVKTSIGKALDFAISKDVVMNMLLLTKDEAERVNEKTRTREREFFKQKLRDLDDATREVYKRALDIGVSIYLVTEEDRRRFAKEFSLPDPEEEYAQEIARNNPDIPEDGYDNAVLYNGGDPMLNENLQYVEENGDYGKIGNNDDDDMDNGAGYWDGTTGV